MRKLAYLLIIAMGITSLANAREIRGKEEIPNGGQYTKQDFEIKGEFEYNGIKYKLGKPKKKENRQFTRSGSSTPVIYNAPGKKVRYCKDVIGYSLATPFQAFGVASEINWDGNDVYFLDVITGAPMGTYVKGTLMENDELVLPMNQTVLAFEDENYDLNLGLLRPVLTPVSDGEGGKDIVIWFEYCEDYDHVVLKKDKNGNIELQDPAPKYTPSGEDPGKYNFPYYAIGYYYTDDYEWSLYCNVTQTYQEFDFEEVTLPANLPEFKMSYVNFEGMGVIVTVYESDEALYIKGLSAFAPEAVFKADLIDNGTRLSIMPNQYVGLEQDIYYIITSTGYINETGLLDILEDDTPVFMNIERDEETGKVLSITSDNSSPNFLILNDDPFFFWPMDIFRDLVLTRQDDFAGIPSTPYNLDYGDYGYSMGANYIFFRLSSFANNGDIIDINNLYYSIYLNGTPVVFEQQDGLDLLDEDVVMYRGIKEPTTLVPYTFANDVDLYEDMGGTFIVGLYAEGIETVGVQAVYKYNDITTYSGMVTLNTETGEETVTGGTEAGVGTIGNPEIIETQYYNLNGMKISNPGRELYIKIERQPDGKIKATKLINQ